MITEFGQTQFYDAYYKLFSKKYDLSSLSDISLDDHKILMEKAATKFVEHNKGKEEIPDVRYAIWRTHETVHKILKAYSLEEGLKLLDEVDFYRFNLYEQYLEAAYYGNLSPFKNEIDLTTVLSRLVDFWERNKSHIIETGYTETLFEFYPWIPGLFMNLYPEKKPAKIEKLGQNKSGDYRCKYHWRKTNQEYDIRDATSILNSPQVFKVLFGRYARSKLFNVFLRIFSFLEDAVSNGRAQDFTHESLKIILSEIEIHELEIYLLMDKFFLKEQLAGKNLIPSLGGFTKLFRLIGYCEKEQALSLKEFTMMSHELSNLAMPFMFDQNNRWNKLDQTTYSYFFKNCSQDKESATGLIDSYINHEQAEKNFWSDYYLKTNKYIHGELALLENTTLNNHYTPYQDRIITKVKAEYRLSTLFNDGRHKKAGVKERKIRSEIDLPIIKLPSNTKWNDVKMEVDAKSRLIYLDVLGVDIDNPIDLKECKLWGGKARGNQKWETLCFYAEKNGRDPYAHTEIAKDVKKTRISNLRSLLKQTFGITDNPINRGICNMVFNISLIGVNSLGSTIHDWGQVDIYENEIGEIELTIKNLSGIDDNICFSAIELGMVGRNKEYNRRGKLFFTLVRNNGEIYLDRKKEHMLLSHMSETDLQESAEDLETHLNQLFNCTDILFERYTKRVIRMMCFCSSENKER